ncbi:peptidase M23-like protein [Geodermatophilus tzadiensis]|uniref:Peptidase M23-like protein n=1 Tax=Geodermatophilus tzadiensis TaxID=1137988 RepID=A0A2T0TU05_9ACTN|nr:M23 family metallopeptidase [Geodermatophilus tzadiensis]PRY48998.1 peptidase M23-like protein [Geodermatophilus tzadiensis]
MGTTAAPSPIGRRGRLRPLAWGAALAAALLATGCAAAGAAPPAPASSPATPEDQFTPVVAATLDPGQAPVLGTDGRLHVVYEIQLTNAKPVPATLQEIRVLDGEDPDRVIATIGTVDLPGVLRDLTGKTPAASLVIEPFASRLVLVHVTFDVPADVPASLLHRFLLTGAPLGGGAEPGPLDYTAASYTLTGTPPVLGPPLAGDNWVAFNGCCSADGIHRNTVLPVNGHLADTQRFAIDWMRLDEQGRIVVGDPADVHSYQAYGAEVLAVADATVVATLDSLPDQVPGQLPDPSTITLANVDGNHVVLDLGDGRYAFYAHLQQGSVTVAPGDRVHRGEVLGLLGNSGNTSAPHLHVHLMDGTSVLGSSGLPYTYDALDLVGSLDAAQFAAATSYAGTWDLDLLPTPEPRTEQFPLDLDVVDFPER